MARQPAKVRTRIRYWDELKVFEVQWLDGTWWRSIPYAEKITSITVAVAIERKVKAGCTVLTEEMINELKENKNV